MLASFPKLGAEEYETKMMVWVYFIQIFVVGSERSIFSAVEFISAVQGHPRSLILAPIERAYATSYAMAPHEVQKQLVGWNVFDGCVLPYFWPTVLSVAPLAHCVVCLSVCRL